MSDQPLLTVLMAVHNGMPYLADSLESIARQTYRDFEFLIIDDASTDGSSGLLQSWVARDSRIRLLQLEQNLGLTATLNIGLTKARGTWIARQDADDLSHPRRLELQMKEIRRRPDLALLGTNGLIIDEQGHFRGLINAPAGESGLQWSAVFNNPFLHSSVCFHREKISALGGYDPEYRVAQDYNLWIRVLRQWPADNLPQRLIRYRVHRGSVTAATAVTENRRRLLDAVTTQALDLAGLKEFVTPGTLSMLEAWRQGVSSPGFWQLQRRMLGVFRRRYPQDRSLASARALLHWRAAGALSNPFAVLREMFSGFFRAPSFFLGLLADRMRGAVAW